jgi:transposase
MVTPESWPTDPCECHDLLTRLSQQVEDLQAALDQAAQLHDQTVHEHEQTVQELRHQLELYRRYVFGPRRERQVEAPGQGHLFELHPAEIVPLPPEPPAPSRKLAARRRSRKLDYDRLIQNRIEHDVPTADKFCSQCGEPKARIGEDLARELEFIPARFELHIHILPKYACSHCRDGVVAPPTPPRPLSGCIAGPGLLAQVVVCKFSDHLPLYRLEDISTRHGLYLPRSTLCAWVAAVANLLKPLYELQQELVRQGPVIWTDDTPVTVLGGGEKGGSHKGRFWVYIGPNTFPYDVYDFTVNRARDGPAQFLANYAGYLQADAFSGYDGIYTGSDGKIVEVACWAHARRKFFEARSSSPADASLILQMIRRLYEVEDRARPLDDAGKCAVRLAAAVPVLERLRAELDRLAGKLLPKSALAQATNYALNQWPALCRYTQDGRLTIDNNVAERRLRDQAIGRKNWMFLGSDEAGPRAAVLCTIIAGAKRHRLEPWAYLHDVILQLSVDANRHWLEGLLPDRWAEAHPEHVLSHRLEESRQKAHQRDQRRARRKQQPT